jgi:hypothetical protein
MQLLWPRFRLRDRVCVETIVSGILIFSAVYW